MTVGMYYLDSDLIDFKSSIIIADEISLINDLIYIKNIKSYFICKKIGLHKKFTLN